MQYFQTLQSQPLVWPYPGVPGLSCYSHMAAVASVANNSMISMLRLLLTVQTFGALISKFYHCSPAVIGVLRSSN